MRRPARSPAAVVILMAILVPAGRAVQAQSLNPPYLSEFPTVERVKKAMQVSDPKETAVREIGAFWQLGEIIKALSGHREFRGFLPDEMKVLTAYSTAEYRIGLAADSAFPGPYKGSQHLSEYAPYRYMRTDRRFGVEGLDLFRAVLTPVIQAQYDQVVGVERGKMAVRAHEDSIARAEGERRMTQPAGAQQQPMTQLQKEQQGIRRCVESGRSETQCLTEGIGKSFMNMIGGFLPPGLTPPAIVGVRVVGTYPGPGKFSLSFSNESASLTCGDLQPQTLEYTTTMTAGGLRIGFDGSVLPFPFTMRADGRLVGPAEANISGQVITGYQQGTRTWSDGRTEPISRPIYEPRTRRCTIGALAVSSPTTQLAPASALPAATLDFVLGGGSDKKIWERTPTGLRLSGEYGSQAALDLEFRPEGVVVGCRETVILRQYLVRLQGTLVMIDVQHGATPFTLTLGADGKLTGSGAVKVDGRAITGSSANGEFTYAPRSASCAVGPLAPGS